jgi:hypothetical protein
LIDRGATARHLVRGHTDFDVLFEHDIRAQGSGLIEVKPVYAP